MPKKENESSEVLIFKNKSFHIVRNMFILWRAKTNQDYRSFFPENFARLGKNWKLNVDLTFSFLV